MISLRFKKIYVLFFVVLLIFSCTNEDISVNEVIYNHMKTKYLWYEQVPNIDPTGFRKPEELLSALIYKPLDHWSYIMKYDEYIKTFKQGKFYGHGFGYGLDSENRIRISFVFKNSDLFAAGVRRGWIISKINAVAPDTSNISKLLGDNTNWLINTFVFTRPSGSDTTLSFSKKELVMNMVLYRDTFHVANKIVGFLVFKGFFANAAVELDEAFSFFKKNNITEFILDLRYNGGGELGIANQMANLIAGNIASQKAFATLTYNKKYTASNQTYKISRTSNSLNISRLFVLTTGGTASASEAIINGLKPFMDVKTIGSATLGKPVGMNVEDLSKYWYVLVPITFKLTNINGEGDYFDGIPVSCVMHDDVTRDFSDRLEANTAQAFNYIKTGTFSPTLKSTYFDQYVPIWNGWKAQIGAY